MSALQFQFALPLLFLMLILISVWLAAGRYASRQARARHKRYQQIASAIRELVGGDCFQLTPDFRAAVQVKRPQFNDSDLRLLLARHDDMKAQKQDGGIYYLDLSDTSITDHGVGQLRACDRLESLILTRTAVTDAGSAAIANLPHLQLLMVDGAEDREDEGDKIQLKRVARVH